MVRNDNVAGGIAFALVVTFVGLVISGIMSLVMRTPTPPAQEDTYTIVRRCRTPFMNLRRQEPMIVRRDRDAQLFFKDTRQLIAVSEHDIDTVCTGEGDNYLLPNLWNYIIHYTSGLSNKVLAGSVVLYLICFKWIENVIKHELKSWVGLFEPIMMGIKTHELRVMDRDYQVGDKCLLNEYDPLTKTYTGRKCVVEITYITSDLHQPRAFSPNALHPAMSVLSIKLLEVIQPGNT